MPTFYNFTQDGLTYSFDDIFVPADFFRDGDLWTWGRNSYGRLGINNIANRSTPVTTFAGGTNWKQVDCSNRHTVAIKTDGTLWIWGRGANGILGNNTSSGDISTPITTFAGGIIWKQVSCGGYHTAAIKTDGSLWVWGLGSNGRLGTNDQLNKSTPVTTFAGANNWKQVSCGANHTTAIKTDGTLWVWGFNSNGQLGTDNTATVSTPVTTFTGGTNWKQISAGYSHTAAIKTDGTLWTWGNNTSGRLGINNQSNRSAPVTTFAGGTNWKQINCGFDHTAAIKTDGTLWTWGGGAAGQLGNNLISDRLTPITTFAGGTNWKQVDNGFSYTIAVKTDGTLWVWGDNLYGKLGTNNAIGISTPVTTFAGGTSWKQVSCGANHTIAITYDTEVI